MRAKGAGDTGVALGGWDGDVVGQSIKPDIGDEVGIERQRDSPVQARGRPTDAQILKHIVLQETEHFVAPISGGDKRRVLLNVIN